MSKKRMKNNGVEKILDNIKDAMEDLQHITNEKQRAETAQELSDFLALHYGARPS